MLSNQSKHVEVFLMASGLRTFRARNLRRRGAMGQRPPQRARLPRCGLVEVRGDVRALGDLPRCTKPKWDFLHCAI